MLSLAAAVAALALAAPAAAQPDLIVIPYVTALGRTADTEVDLDLSGAAAPTQRVEVYVPAGYRLAVGEPVGTSVGPVALAVGAAAATTLTGSAVVADPAQHAADACAPGAHAAVWLLNLTRPQAVSIVVYVDPLAADDPLGAYRLTACFAPDVLPGVAGSSLRGLSLEIERALTNPSQAGSHRWRAFVTPYAAGSAVPNPATQFELRSLSFLPVALSLKGRRDRRTGAAVLTGRLLLARTGAARIRLRIFSSLRRDGSGLKLFASATTRRGGFFTVRKRITRTTYFFAFLPVYTGACVTGTSAAPGGCLRETTSPGFGSVARVLVGRR